MTDLAGNVVGCDTHPPQQVQPQLINTMMTYGFDFLNDPFDLLTALEANCHVHVGAVWAVSQLDSHPGTIRSNATKPIDHLTLAARWGIPPVHAKQTIWVTTQHGTQTMTPFAQQYPTNDCMLWYNHVAHKMFCDTLIAGTPSHCDNKYDQVLAINFSWCCIYHM